jgi:thymidylate synthase (FAD)
MDQTYDIFESLKTKSINVLDHGRVQLIDVMPRIVPLERTCEYSIVQSARVSTGRGLKSIDEDNRLIRYLYLHQHTSPFESVKFTFHIRAPIAVRTHFIRHRTANVNEFSQRYAPLETVSNDENWFYKASNSLRSQSVVNKQGSGGELNDDETVKIAQEGERLCNDLLKVYENLLQHGVAREVARMYLPLSTYTEFYFTMDLHNLLKFLWLRDDKHTQEETRVFATAMRQLITPLVPNVIEVFESRRQGISFTIKELEFLSLSEDEKKDRKELSKRELAELNDKVQRMNFRN